jgi:hypothetical protein
MSDHMLWAEAQDKARTGDLITGYAFFGHPSMSISIFAPRIDSAFLLNPAGEKLSLALKKGDWLPGYGHMEYLFSDMMLDRQGDYVFGLVRTPGVYDLSWHGGKSGLFLTRSFAKVIIHAGKEGQNVQESQSSTWDAGFPLEIIPKRAPYGIKATESLTLKVKYLGRPVKASYYASYWAWDEQGDSRVQRGTTDEDGSFSVHLNRGGMWIIDASLTQEESGTLIADDTRKFYKAGDVLEYKTIQIKTELTIWVQ